MFEPLTRPEDLSFRRLLIADGDSSYVTARIIAFCMQHTTYLLILPPYCSHELQPLDAGACAPLKRALAQETNGVARLDSERMLKVEWTEMYIRARDKGLATHNIYSLWRAAGLESPSPITVPNGLGSRGDAAQSEP